MKKLSVITECISVSAVMISLIVFLCNSYASLTKQEPAVFESHIHSSFTPKGPLKSYEGNFLHIKETPRSPLITKNLYVK